MNKTILIGRLTRDPEVRYGKGEEPIAIARYTLAVDRSFQRAREEKTADFIPCVAFGRAGEFAEKYFRKGTKLAKEYQERLEALTRVTETLEEPEFPPLPEDIL